MLFTGRSKSNNTAEGELSELQRKTTPALMWTPQNFNMQDGSVSDNATAIVNGNQDDVYDEDSSENEEMRDRLIPRWLNSVMNNTDAQTIKEKGLYLWAFGENGKRALAVQSKDNQINGPTISRIPLKAQSWGEEDDFVVEITSADEHSACVTMQGKIFTTGHN